jgi:hypothetical protein
VPDTPNSGGQKKRALPRFSFIASTVLTEPVSDIRLSGRVTEISRAGCYVDILNALPVGTLLNMEITCDLGRFLTQARTVYVHPGIGMGVVFVDPPESQLKVLDAWLAAFPATAAI